MNIGYARTELKPPINLSLAGYLERNYRSIKSRGFLDTLELSTLLIELGDKRVAVVSLDTLHISEAIRNLVVSTCRKVVDCDYCVVTATHTHSGPVLDLEDPFYRIFSVDPSTDRELLSGFYPQLRQVLREVFEKVTETRRVNCIKLYRVEGGVAANRRDPSGPVDREITVFRFRAEDLDLLCLVYGCHPTVLGPDNAYYSGDFTYYVREYLRRFLNCEVMWFTGACGDVSTRFTRRGRGVSEARRVGYVLGSTVATALFSETALELPTEHLCVEVEELDVGTSVPEIEEVLERKRSIEEKIRRLKEVPIQLRHELLALELLEKYYDVLCRVPKVVKVRHTAIALSDVALTFVPYEMFAQYSLALKQLNCTLVCYADSYLGYLPTPSAIKIGGYETLFTVLNFREIPKIVSSVVRVTLRALLSA
ncbi:MAG: hypothetical protein DRJ40_05320 [Thermoprotei archaeon]|nr:MAG: hypothetical protein DRJ40_04205 [Thermoprotei archaeon]RLE56815.1 MAG: hypothetical protein DRJ40_05320 [Thermoprotei archaeon]